MEEQTASSLGTTVGETIDVVTVDGKRAKRKVTGLYRDPMMLNGVILSDAGYAELFAKPQLFMVFARNDPGTPLAQTGESLKLGAGRGPDRGGEDARRSTRTAWSGRSTSS